MDGTGGKNHRLYSIESSVYMYISISIISWHSHLVHHPLPQDPLRTENQRMTLRETSNGGCVRPSASVWYTWCGEHLCGCVLEWSRALSLTFVYHSSLSFSLTSYLLYQALYNNADLILFGSYTVSMRSILFELLYIPPYSIQQQQTILFEDLIIGLREESSSSYLSLPITYTHICIYLSLKDLIG